MPYHDANPSKIIKSKDFLLIVLGYTVLCILRALSPHPHIKDASSPAFYGALIVYPLFNIFLIFSMSYYLTLFLKLMNWIKPYLTKNG